ncbi:hypothetical protein pdam_00019390 [Pocillopora damicornis]|uniref:Uncharacterized protein n=1 Tax=Pocillopora damicornis TaxID=46731 RepID=A0A3M6UG78_POCDA|nr:hypothetical protein pdam_00019390 [Pocillopora damicornis]
MDNRCRVVLKRCVNAMGCVGLPPINSTICDSVCPESNLETRACNIHDCPVEYNSLGCFKDSTPRALPLLLKNFRGNIHWTDSTKVVRACAEIAKERGLPVFGIQYCTECWTGLDAGNTYNMYGPSGNCWNGVGKGRANYVYKI